MTGPVAEDGGASSSGSDTSAPAVTALIVGLVGLLAGITGVALAPGARLRSERAASPAARLPASRRAGPGSVRRLDCR